MNNYPEKKENFFTLFYTGIIFTGAGIATGFYPLMTLGLLFMGAGLVNRDNWPQNDDIDQK